jgi:hypothetical protein
MHHFSLTYILEIGTGGIILFEKNAPKNMSFGAKVCVYGAVVVQVSKDYGS